MNSDMKQVCAVYKTYQYFFMASGAQVLEEAEFFPSPVLASASAPAPTPNRAGTSGNFNLLKDFFKDIKLTGLETRKYGKD